MLLIKNAKVYAPEYVGKKDLLVCGGKIECMEDKIEDFPIACEVIDAEEKILTPGFIDQHVHVTGGGGEGSFHTRTPELQLSELVKGGITTVVGLLGTDGLTRSVENLYAKVQALCEEGVSAYMLTGAYGYPSPTITGEVDRDIMFVEKVLGVKLAISDHRAPNVTESELIQLASKTRTAGMLSGKPGIVVLHMGDADAGLSPVFEALEKSMIPIKIFRPTHVNRRKGLLEEGYQLLEKGGYIDLTCGISEDFCPGGCILEAKEKGIHTCLDTSGILFDQNDPDKMEKFLELVKVTDLVMLDIKHIEDTEHQKLTGHSNKAVFAFAGFLKEHNIPVWIRHVSVPGITDKREELEALGRYLKTLPNVEKLELLPYHALAVPKYENLGIDYPLKDTPQMSKAEAKAAYEIVCAAWK